MACPMVLWLITAMISLNVPTAVMAKCSGIVSIIDLLMNDSSLSVAMIASFFA